MEVLSTSLSNNLGVTFVDLQVGCNILPKFPEDEGAPSEMEGGKTLVVDCLRDNLRRRTGDKLDNTGRYSCLTEDLVYDVVRVRGGWRWLPDNDVTDQSRGCSQITSDGCEVERSDGKDETFEGTVFSAAKIDGVNVVKGS